MAGGAGAIGFRVIYNDIDDIPARSRHDAEAVDLDTLLKTSDVLTIHVDGRPSNHGFLDAERIGKLSPSTLLSGLILTMMESVIMQIPMMTMMA